MNKQYNIIADANSSYKLSKLPNLIALDGAAEIFKAQNILPTLIIGDLDSIKPSTHKYFKDKNVKIIQIDDQNSTDLDKGILHCLEHDATDIVIHNAIGSRLDHTLYNTRTLKKYHNNKTLIKIINESESIQYLQDCTIEISGNIGQNIAIMAADEAVVSSQGLKYEMTDYLIKFGASESTSNELAKPNAKLTIIGGAFLIS